MKGVLLEKAGAPLKVVDNLDVPEPGPDQLLVKALAVAINPVDTYMQAQGLLVVSFPTVIGCDGSGVVVKVGEKAASSFKVGDEVCGCTRLGTPEHSAFQDYFLMDAITTFRKPANVSTAEAATLGAGTLTACLGLFGGLKIELSDLEPSPKLKDEWVIIFGGASSVGQYAVQIAKLSGFKVIASCSAKSASLVTKRGADATFDYKASEEAQLKVIVDVTKGNFSRIFDAVAAMGALAMKAFGKSTATGSKYFTTTNDWDSIEGPEGVKIDKIQLGYIGREEAPGLNQAAATYIAKLVPLFEEGKLVPNEHRVVGSGGLEGIVDAMAAFQKEGGSSAKLVVKLQDK